MKVSRQTIASWESDAVLPDSSHLQQLSRLFNVPVDTLLAPSSDLPKLSFSEKYNENEVEKITGLTARASAVLSRFGEHYETTPLARKIKLNWWQNLVDIFWFWRRRYRTLHRAGRFTGAILPATKRRWRRTGDHHQGQNLLPRNQPRRQQATIYG